MTNGERRTREEELRADEALFGLSAAERAELEALAPGRGDASYEAAAAAVLVARAGEGAPMPDALARRIVAQAEAHLGGGASPRVEKTTTAAGAQVIVMPVAPGPRGSGARVDYARWSGWVAAAACVVVLVTRAYAPGGGHADPQATAGASEARVAVVPSTDPSGAHAAADLSWSAREQRGELRARGLAPSGVGEEYEAWLMSGAPGGRGAVPVAHFTVGPAEAEVVVALHAPVLVEHATQIVVTVEPAGGVLVSARTRVALTGIFEEH